MRSLANDRLKRIRISIESEDAKEKLKNETIGSLKGRGITMIQNFDCICERQYSHIVCRNCGYLMYGRVKRPCSKHPMTSFLIDITNCPKCRCNDWLLHEIAMEID